MDSQNEINELKALVKYYEMVIKNMSAPIIPSIVPKTILIPIAGIVSAERFELIRTKALRYAGDHRETECVIFDFTGVQSEDILTFDYNELALELTALNNSLKLMGLRTLYVGFNPRFVREIVHAGIQVELEVYQNFRAALKELLKEQREIFS